MKAKFINEPNNYPFIEVESIRLKGYDHDVNPICLQFEDYINWDSIRHQAAIAAMQGLIINGQPITITGNSNQREIVAKIAVACADALIAELKKD